MINQRFGRLVVIADVGQRYWLCRCDCGVEKRILGKHLKSGKIQSCRCLQRERTRAASSTHGRSRDRIYNVWNSAKERCNNPQNKEYKNYGARGIRMCDEWANDFSKFLADMGEPAPELTLDRYPNQNGNYEPGNCRWASASQQARNTRTNRWITYRGETLIQRDWESRLNLPVGVINVYRRYHKLSPEQALDYIVQQKKISL